ncbi:MAG: S8 family peptidase [Elusimicrobia bacterium]|nr:S8 family peptidase [Elusimicrobiota bacterium]
MKKIIVPVLGISIALATPMAPAWALSRGDRAAHAKFEREQLDRIKNGNQKIIIFETGLTAQKKDAIIREAGGEPGRRLEGINAVVGYFPKGIQGDLRSDSHVRKVETDGLAQAIGFTAPVVILGACRSPKDSSSNAEADVDTAIDDDTDTDSGDTSDTGATGDPNLYPNTEYPWGVARIDAPTAWRTGSFDLVDICVIDSGIDVDHPDFSAFTLNGGLNFASSTGTPDTNIDDEYMHGTHVNGIIAAAFNGFGVVGVAPNARLYQAKIFGTYGSSTWSTLIAGIEACIAANADVINMSLGGYPSSVDDEALHLAIQAADSAGITIVAAAGNNYGSSVIYPAAYDEVIAVSAINDAYGFAYFSSKGAEVDIIAPGQEIPSTLPLDYDSDGYGYLSGTSMASPHVAAVAALIRGANSSLSNDQVKEILENTAEDMGLAAEEQGQGLVDAEAAVAAALDMNAGAYNYNSGHSSYFWGSQIPDTVGKTAAWANLLPKERRSQNWSAGITPNSSALRSLFDH